MLGKRTPCVGGNGPFRPPVVQVVFRLIAVAVAVLLLLAACGGAADVGGGATVEGDFVEQADGSVVAPDFTITLADGTEWRRSEQTEPVMLVFWADWCHVCAEELPVIDELVPDYAGDIEFLALAGRGTPSVAAEKAGDYFDSGGWSWAYDESGELWQLFGATGTPTFAFLAADGTVLGVQPGALPPDKSGLFDEVVAIGG